MSGCFSITKTAVLYTRALYKFFKKTGYNAERPGIADNKLKQISPLHKTAILVIFILQGTFSFSQEADREVEIYLAKTEKGYLVHACVENGDTIPWIWLPVIPITAEMKFATRRKYAEWTRIRYNVKKVYPYAILAAAKLKEYDMILEKMPNEQVKKTYMKMCEKELQKQFGEELKNLSINQGRILMKLIDRETGKTTYSIVKEMRGNFQAFMWQSLAVLFGSSMKQEFDAAGEDRLIEIAIHQVEAGEF